MNIKLLSMVVCIVTLTGCATPEMRIAGECPPKLRDAHERLNALLWVQTSAEYRTLSAATYRDASLAIERILGESREGRKVSSAAIEQAGDNIQDLPLAVIVDIDETVLDNSPMSGQLIRNRQGYDSDVWSKWVSLKRANFIAGADIFIRKARELGIEVFFVTNRTESEEANTIEDLKPIVVSDEQILASKEMGPGETVPWESEKSDRRAFLARNYWIVAMIGDDLADFIPNIRKMESESRVEEAMKHMSRFGSQWFLLPNPIYGSWENVLYNNKDDDEKQLVDKINKTKGYE